MKARDIRDIESLAAWIESRPADARSRESASISIRVAARIFPIVGLSIVKSGYTSERAHLHLQIMRCLLTASISVKQLNPENLVRAASFASSAARTASLGDRTEALVARAADTAANVTVPSSATEVTVFAISALEVSSSSTGELFNRIRDDAVRIETGEDPLSSALWLGPPPNWFKHADSQLRDEWSDSAPYLEDEQGNRLTTEEGEFLRGEDESGTSAFESDWDFWSRWWEGVKSGQHVNWDLQRAIALIPDEDWQQGPAHIAAIVARLEEQFDLRRQVAELRTKLQEAEFRDQASYATVAHRSHNHPPEVLEAATEARREITIVLQVLEDAEKELSLQAPSSAILKRNGAVLREAGKSIAKYCLKLVDLAVTTTLVAGTTAVVSYECLKYAPEIEGIGKSLIEFAAKLVVGS